MSDAPKWIIRRFNWKCCHDGKQLRQAPGEHRVAWFDTETDAQAECVRRETDVRGRVNPFQCGPAFHYLSTFPEYAFRDWLLDADIRPANNDSLKTWALWWEDTRNPTTRAKVWEGLNRVRFHDVISRHPSEVAYVVMQVMWAYDDTFYRPGDEGGRIMMAYRTREKAELECWVLNEQMKEDREPDHRLYADRWREGNWPFTRHEHLGEPGECPMYEVVEIDLGTAGAAR